MGDDRDDTPHRRSDDRDRELYRRLEVLERSYQTIQTSVVGLESSLNLVKFEQVHLREFFDARLKLIERAGELQLTKIETLSGLITAMASDVEKSPVGRAIQSDMRAVTTCCDDHRIAIQQLRQWQDRVDGVLLLLKVMGVAGVISLVGLILRIAKLIP